MKRYLCRWIDKYMIMKRYISRQIDTCIYVYLMIIAGDYDYVNDESLNELGFKS